MIKWVNDSGRQSSRTGRTLAAGIVTAVAAGAVTVAPLASATPHVPVQEAPIVAVPEGPYDRAAVKIVEGVTWLLKEAGKSYAVNQAIEFVVNALPKDGPRTLEQTLASAPRFNSVSDPQTILWQSAGLVGPTNGVIKGDADALFNSMAAAGQRTGSNSLRNGVFTVTLDRGSKSRPPVFTIANAAITKTVMVLN